MKLDLGCGKNKKPGYIGLDKVNTKGVDIVCDMEKPLPFPDNTFDGIYSFYTLEHVLNFEQLVEEMWRVCKNGAIINLMVPHWSSWGSHWPCHKTFFSIGGFNLYSIEMFTWENPTKAKFKILKERLRYILAGRLSFLSPIMEWLANLNPIWFQRFFIHLIPFEAIEYELEVVK